VKKYEWIRCVGLFALLGITLILAACGGGGGLTNEQLEAAIQAKSQQLFPSELASILDDSVAQSKKLPNYSQYLMQTNQSLEVLSKAILALPSSTFPAFALNRIALPMADQRFVTADISTNLQNFKNMVNEVKQALSSNLGDIYSQGKSAFLNLGMGYSRGVFAVGGFSWAEVKVVGGEGYVNLGTGLEDVYDFLHFKRGTVQSSFCAAGVGIRLGVTVPSPPPPSLTAEGSEIEDLIFGFRDSVGDYEGPAIGAEAGLDLEGQIVAGLGLTANTNVWKGGEGTCDQFPLGIPSCTPVSFQGISQMWGYGGATGVYLEGGHVAKAIGGFGGDGYLACVAPPTSTSSYLDNSLPAQLKYKIAGFKAATDILLDSSGYQNPVIRLPAAIIAILYGMLYEPSFTLTVMKSGTGSGSVTSDPPGIDCGATCTASFASGQTVTLTATPGTGSSFSGWSGDPDCTDGQVTMDADRTCTATFAIGSPPSWQVWVVDEAGDAGRSPSLAFAPDGNPSISYHTWIPTYDLKYAHWNGTIWDLIVVEELPANSDPNDGTSLAFDGGGNPSISYLHHIIPQSFNGKLWFAQKSGSSWALQQIPDSDAVGQHSSLRYDSSGYPVIAYHQFIPFSGGVKQARWTGSNWQVEYVDTDPGEVGGVHTSLALDTANTPHISYGAGNGANQGELRYATWTGSAWAIQVVDSGIGSIYPLSSIFTSIALDSAGRPRIAYRDAIRGDLKFAQWTGSAWIIETIDSADDVGWWCSLVIDASGNSWISYYDVTTQSVKLAVNRGSGWEISTIDSGLGTDGNLGYTSLALDHAGNPAIAYYDAVNGDLKLAWFR